VIRLNSADYLTGQAVVEAFSRVGRDTERVCDVAAQGGEVMHLARIVADAILSASADAVVATDRDGVIRIWNAGAERIFGYSANEALGQSLDLIIPERLRDRHWRGYRQVMKTGESRYGHGDVLSVPSMRKDGQQISVEFTLVPLKDGQEQMTGMAAVMRDVTERFAEMKVLRQKLAEATGSMRRESAAR
jgi:PAS domain S-box-containing protein